MSTELSTALSAGKRNFSTVNRALSAIGRLVCCCEELKRKLKLGTLLHCLSTNCCSAVCKTSHGDFLTTSLGACEEDPISAI